MLTLALVVNTNLPTWMLGPTAPPPPPGPAEAVSLHASQAATAALAGKSPSGQRTKGTVLAVRAGWERERGQSGGEQSMGGSAVPHIALANTTGADCPMRKRFRGTAVALVAPRVLLHAYMGSGNTWLRLLLENATGLYTGTPYRNGELVGTLGMRGEGVTNSSVLLVLDHCVKGFGDKGPERCLKGYNKVLFLVRNPFDALVAERKRVVNMMRLSKGAGGGLEGGKDPRNMTHTQTPPWADFVTRSAAYARPWIAWAPRHMRIWAASARAMLGSACASVNNVSRVAVAAPNATIPLLLLKYEDLVTDVTPHLQRALAFLGQRPSLAPCVLASQQGGAGSGQAKREPRGATVLQYPACPYTQAMLHDLLRKAGPCFSALGYSLPPSCIPVHAGVHAGGTDAVPIP